MSGEQMTFGSVEEELDYWKDQALQCRQQLEDLRMEYDEFRDNSDDLEAELDRALDQAESKNKELMVKLQRVEEENESLKSRLEAQHNESYVTVSTLQAEKQELIQIKESLFKYVRELEQINDDLERAKRVTMTSLEDFEMRMNTALERNAILENELDEKEQVTITCQRLKDEVRDLRSELDVKVKKGSAPADLYESETSGHSRSALASQPSTVSVATSPMVKSTPTGTPSHVHAYGHSVIHQPQPITPSARISALTLVSDLLRKVGALENRLASCRTSISKESMRHPRTTSPVQDSPSRPKRTHLQRFNGEAPMAATAPSAGNLTKITV